MLLLKNDPNKYWNNVFGFESLMSTKFNDDTFRYPQKGVYLHQSKSYTLLSLYEGFARLSSKRTFSYFASLVPNFSEKLYKSLDYINNFGSASKLVAAAGNAAPSERFMLDQMYHRNRIVKMFKEYAELHKKIMDPKDTSVPKKFIVHSWYGGGSGFGNRFQSVTGIL